MNSQSNKRIELLNAYADLKGYYADSICPVIKYLHIVAPTILKKLPTKITLKIVGLLGLVKLAVGIMAKDGSKILDVGSGTARIYLYDGIPNASVTGLDLRTGSDSRVMICDVEKSGALEKFEVNSFDFIVLDQSFEHFFSPEKLLSRLKPLLAKEGWLIIAVPNIKSFSTTLFGINSAVWDNKFHISNFSKDSLFKCVSRAGYTINRIETYNLAIFFFISLFNQFQHKGKRSIEFSWTYHLLSPVIKIIWGMLFRFFGDGECVVVFARK